MRHFLFILFIIVFYQPQYLLGQNNIYRVSAGTIYFHSDAPLELIKASSKDLIGAVDIVKRTFLFKIDIASFQGFNSPRQREHFNENYMESDVFPLASYSGKIIEEIDLTKNGEYNIRAKGKLSIHGIELQRLIKCRVVCKNGEISVQSDFVMLLADYNIKIPRIVSDKLSPEIHVSVNAVLTPKTN